MNSQMKNWVAIAATMIIFPWMTWVSVSIFSQRQEIALLKLSNEHLKEIKQALIGKVKPSR